jgi:hypothetical protein
VVAFTMSSKPNGLLGDQTRLEFPKMDEITEQFARRDRMRKKLAALESYSERMQKMAVLQETTWKALRASPSGWAHFLKRNFKARAIDVANPDATRPPTV